MCELCTTEGNLMILEEEERRARRPHKCVECERKIRPKETYTHLFAIARTDCWRRGEGYSCDTCSSCVKDWDVVMQLFRNGNHHPVLCHGGLREAVGIALELGFLKENDPLVIKWLPGVHQEKELPPLENPLQ